MVNKEINWMAGGPQGAGVDSAANIFGRACGFGGLYVFGRREYHSNIKGLHSYFHLRVSPHEVLANVNDELQKYMGQRGIGETLGGFLDDARKNHIQVFEVPYMDLLKQVASKLGIDKISKITRMI